MLPLVLPVRPRFVTVELFPLWAAVTECERRPQLSECESVEMLEMGSGAVEVEGVYM